MLFAPSLQRPVPVTLGHTKRNIESLAFIFHGVSHFHMDMSVSLE